MINFKYLTHVKIRRHSLMIRTQNNNLFGWKKVKGDPEKHTTI